MNSENKGYSLAVANGNNDEKQAKVYLKPMALYVPDIAVQAVAELIGSLSVDNEQGKGFILSVTNNNNGISVDKEFATLVELQDPLIAADAVKDLVNIVRGYESDEETNVCGW
ncbi:DUF1869 domain-containing protein [Raoultella terrigena]|uniref:DUF1869 domain-containing protein n=1 Tax=Raoultella terrigena TaxID=577 RepID=UPI00132F5C0C|nr:DUF1869 domain-containing protein [Raoultella terrigena]MCI1030854.1 DUF1869 domain-containing protein [Raoultella terrigena]